MYSYWTDSAPVDLVTGIAEHDVFHPVDLLINVGVATAIIATVGGLTEFLVRRFRGRSRMTNKPPLKRRLPRYSLITLLVAVNVAGVLLWANVREVTGRAELSESDHSVWTQRGWPFPYHTVVHFVRVNSTDGPRIRLTIVNFVLQQMRSPDRHRRSGLRVLGYAEARLMSLKRRVLAVNCPRCLRCPRRPRFSHSSRNACSGSIFDARRAGTNEASMPSPTTASPTVANVVGSVGATS